MKGFMRSIKRWFLNNPGLKVASLILAVLLWLYIEGELGVARLPIQKFFAKKTYDAVDVRVLGGALKAFPAKVGPSKVDLVLSGPKGLLNELEASGILAFVDCTGLEKGKYELSLTVVLPEGITLISDIPTIEVTIK